MRFSIITCTYNPNPAIFGRVLKACADLVEARGDAEYIIVDNNSRPALQENGDVKDTLARTRRIKLVTEKVQGQTYARIRGAKASQGEVLVFADDDNLLAKNYLDQLEQLLAAYPRVAVWGPSNIRVEFPEGAPAWVDRHFRHLFQERKGASTRFGLETDWAAYYPVGSGMVIKREVFEAYAKDFKAGGLTAGGRSGDSLLCGEDSQMVWTAVKLGDPAGSSPKLALTHLIPARRASLGYMRRLQYNIAFSYVSALTEIFPEKKKELKPLSLAGQLMLVTRIARKTGLNPLLLYRTYVIENAWFKGIKAWSKKQ